MKKIILFAVLFGLIFAMFIILKISLTAHAVSSLSVLDDHKFVRGDVNQDNFVNIADAIFIFDYLFAKGNKPECLDSADIDDNGVITIGDGISILNYLFAGGSRPKPPFPEAGYDETSDDWECEDEDAGTSYLVCELNPETGKNNLCRCVFNENKNKISVIVNKNGIYNNEITIQKISNLLESISSDLNIENIGISYFEGSSVEELDHFIDNLYNSEDVAYAIIIGDELNIYKEQEPFNAISYSLSLVEKDIHLPNGMLNDEIYCKDVIISWITPLFHKTDKDKISFVNSVVDRYADYHKNENNIIDQFKKDCLRIQWENGYPVLGADLDMDEIGYDCDITLVYNHDYDKVEEELAEKHYLTYYAVHGSSGVIGIGLNPFNDRKVDPVYTTHAEFEAFVSEHGTPSLFMHEFACQSVLPVQEEGISSQHCCWPQTMMKAGIWVFYSAYAGGPGANSHLNFERDVTDESFYGLSVRKNPTSQYFAYGDLTAHF